MASLVPRQVAAATCGLAVLIVGSLPGQALSAPAHPRSGIPAVVANPPLITVTSPRVALPAWEEFRWETARVRSGSSAVRGAVNKQLSRFLDVGADLEAARDTPPSTMGRFTFLSTVHTYRCKNGYWCFLREEFVSVGSAYTSADSLTVSSRTGASVGRSRFLPDYLLGAAATRVTRQLRASGELTPGEAVTAADLRAASWLPLAHGMTFVFDECAVAGCVEGLVWATLPWN